MPSEELQGKWAKLLKLLQRETRTGGITWKPVGSQGHLESKIETYGSSSRDLTYLITGVRKAWGDECVFEIRDELGEVVGTIKSEDEDLNNSLRTEVGRLWVAINETKSRLNDVLDRAIMDLEPPF